MPRPSLELQDHLLRDGSRVRIRPVLPEDKARLQEGLARMSDESRYYRFMSYLTRLSESQLRYLTEIDYERHMAWIALDPSSADLPVLGVARYVRLENEPDVAEAAVAVVDSHHGRGLGTLLLGLLSDAAARNGIRHFRVYVLAGNLSMIHLFQDLGAITTSSQDNVFVMDMTVPESPEDLPDTPVGRVFRAVARRAVSFPEPKFHEPEP